MIEGWNDFTIDDLQEVIENKNGFWSLFAIKEAKKVVKERNRK